MSAKHTAWSIIFAAIILAVLLALPAQAVTPSQGDMQTEWNSISVAVLITCSNRAVPGGTVTIADQAFSVWGTGGFARFWLSPGTYTLRYNGSYAATINAYRHTYINRSVYC